MRTVKFTKHHDVEMYEFGYAPIGKPAMTVYCYYVDGLLIDTAQANAGKTVWKTLKPKPIKQIALTHWHEDHTGNIAFLQKRLNPIVYADPFTVEKVKSSFSVLPYEQYMFGKIKPALGEFQDFPEVIQTENYEFTPIHTPGHSEDHHVFLEKNQGWLFSGDLYVGIKIKFFRLGEDIQQQIDSMKLILQQDFDVIFCGHYPQFKNAKDLFKAKVEYFESFYGEVAQLYHKGYTPKQIIRELGLKEVHLVRLITFNDVSMQYMVESVIENEKKKGNAIM